MCQYEKEWFFSCSAFDVDRGKNIFTLPPDDDVIREEVNRLEFCFRQSAGHFDPVNRLVWDALFPGWQKIQPVIDLIVGFPEPYDAVTMNAPDGRVLEPSGLFLMDGIQGFCSLPRHSVDMLLTDPPYGTTRNDRDVLLPLIEFWEAVRQTVKPDGAVLLFAQCPYDKVLGASNLARLR